MESKNQSDILIMGAGIVGLSSAYKLSLRFPELKITVLEKEEEVAIHQTGHNSGVIHSGLYYKPGTYKAKNCVEGRRELVEFAKQHQITHDICGKVVVATDESEFTHLDRVFENGLKNEVEGIEKINANQIKEIEPHCIGLKGIWVPCTGIIDFAAVSRKLKELINAHKNSRVYTGYKVIGLHKSENGYTIQTQKENFNSKFIINCTGLFCDRVAKMDDVNPNMQIVGFRGDYFDLTDKGMHKVKNLIYPVPNPAFPFLGVHFTRMIKGGVECGPNAVFTFKREGYKKTDFNLKDTFQALSYSGTWNLFFRHWRFGLDEYKRAFSKRLFLNRLQKLIPDLEMDDLKPGRAGVRAMALDKNGDMIDDFKFVNENRALHVLNAPSPAATSGLAIGTAIAHRAEENFQLNMPV